MGFMGLSHLMQSMKNSFEKTRNNLAATCINYFRNLEQQEPASPSTAGFGSSDISDAQHLDFEKDCSLCNGGPRHHCSQNCALLTLHSKHLRHSLQRRTSWRSLMVGIWMNTVESVESACHESHQQSSLAQLSAA